jgi:hypothetical protein
MFPFFNAAFPLLKGGDRSCYLKINIPKKQGGKALQIGDVLKFV